MVPSASKKISRNSWPTGGRSGSDLNSGCFMILSPFALIASIISITQSARGFVGVLERWAPKTPAESVVLITPSGSAVIRTDILRPCSSTSSKSILGFSFKSFWTNLLFSSEAGPTVKEDVWIYPPNKFVRMAISSGKLIRGVPERPIILDPLAPSRRR